MESQNAKSSLVPWSFALTYTSSRVWSSPVLAGCDIWATKSGTKRKSLTLLKMSVRLSLSRPDTVLEIGELLEALVTYVFWQDIKSHTLNEKSAWHTLNSLQD